MENNKIIRVVTHADASKDKLLISSENKIFLNYINENGYINECLKKQSAVYLKE